MTTTRTHGDRTARVLGAVAIGLAAVALVTGVLVPRLAIGLGVATLVCAAIAWARTDRADRVGRRLAIWGVVLAIVAGLVVGASQSASSGAVGEPAPTATVDDLDGAATDEVLSKGLAIDVGSYVVEDAALALSGLPVGVTNVSAAGDAFRVALEARDAGGNVVARDEVAVDDLTPGTTTTVWAFDAQTASADVMRHATVHVRSVETV